MSVVGREPHLPPPAPRGLWDTLLLLHVTGASDRCMKATRESVGIVDSVANDNDDRWLVVNFGKIRNHQYRVKVGCEWDGYAQ